MRNRSRRGGWLWPAVLVASAGLLVMTGTQLMSPPQVAADIPVVQGIQDAPTVSPSPVRPAQKPARVPTWTTRPAAPPAVVAAVAPVRLVARSVDLDLDVVPEGVDRHGQMSLPDKPSVLGWYRFGAAPADPQGAVVLAGHVDSDRYGSGPLVRAAGLARGDRIEVRDAKGRTTTYEVARVQRVHKSDFASDTIFERTGPRILRLITCGGVYDPDRGGYQDNLVVTATPR